MKNLLKYLSVVLFLSAICLFAHTSNAQEVVHERVEEMPVPPGGLEGFISYMTQTIKYPETAKNAKIEGKVFVSFVVKSDGTVDAIKVVQGIGGGCDEEAIRVVQNSGSWTPGKIEGKAVATKMILPIQFKM